jgi:hypothetical protein
MQNPRFGARTRDLVSLSALCSLLNARVREPALFSTLHVCKVPAPAKLPVAVEAPYFLPTLLGGEQ